MHALHWPLLQLMLQQSVSALQLSLAGLQVSQRFPRSTEHVEPPQHESGEVVQLSLLAVHEPAAAPQVCWALQTPPQHSAAVAHGAPFR
jgi:hypothetical protein